MTCWTVSIQNVAVICVVCAFGLAAVLSPRRKAMLSVPPPKSGLAGLVAMEMTAVEVMVWPAMASRRIVLGSSRMAWVIVPSLMNGVRSWGIRRVCGSLAFWLGNRPDVGVMLTGGILGGPLITCDVPWAQIVVPCGIEAIRTRVAP